MATRTHETNAQKADDIRSLSSRDLMEKYPDDSVIFNAIATKQAAERFAKKRLSSQSSKEQFVNIVVERYAEKVEKGRFDTEKIKEDPDRGR